MEKIDQLIKSALKDQNKAALTGFRAVKSKILLEKTKGLADFDFDKQFNSAVKKEIKERQENNSLFQDESDPRLVENNGIIKALESFLPKVLSQSEQNSVIDKLIAELGASSALDFPAVMQVLKKNATNLDMKSAVAYIKQKLT